MKNTKEPSQNQILLRRLRQIVLQNLTNEQFSVELFSKEVGLSRSHLHRKLKLLTGKSTSQFIREIRLEEAKQLLEDNHATASEVAFMVGFSSSSYFNTCFNTFYGFPPGELKKRNSKKFVTTKLEPSIITERYSQVAPAKSTTWQKSILLFIIISGALLLSALLLPMIRPTADSPQYNSIAILPLDYLSADPTQQYLAQGIQDALIGAIGEQSNMHVISKASTKRFNKKHRLLQEVALDLGVDAILEGSFYHQGDHIRLRLQLVGAFPAEKQLWSEEYQLLFDDMLATQNELVQNISTAIQSILAPESENSPKKLTSVNPEALEAYLKGMFYWDKLTEENLNTAMKYFELALEIDPNYAPALSGMSLVWVGRMQQGLTSYFEGGSNMKIIDIKAKLMALNLDLPEIHYALGVQSCWVDWNYEMAEKELKKAIALNPNHSSARAYLSHVLNILHKPAEAMEQIEIALKLDPYNPLFQALNGMNMLYARQFDKAINTLSKILVDAPTDPVALSTLRTAYHMKGFYPQALDTWITSYAAKEDQAAVEALMRGNRSGGYAQALATLAETLIDRSDSIYVTPWQIGTLYTRAGNKKEALSWLEKAYEAHDSNMPYIGVDPIFEFLWNEDRFQNLLVQMKLPKAKHPLASSRY